MNNFTEIFALLRRNCEASPSFMLTKALSARESALDSVLMFDEIADFPVDVTREAHARSEIVKDLLTKAISSKADEIRSIKEQSSKETL